MALLACPGAVSVADDAGAPLDAPIVFTQLPAGTEIERQPGCGGGMLRCGYGDGARIVVRESGGDLRVLSQGFASACEPSVFFDGKRILFAARRDEQEPWNVWEMNADGTGARQVTRRLGNCRRPAYQATIYTIGAHGAAVAASEPWYQIMFVSDAAEAMNEFGSGPATNLYSSKLDGSAVRRLTMNLSDDLDPFLMDDGRVLLASWQRVDLRRGLRGQVSLFGVNTDGADYALYAGQQGRRIRHMPCETADGLVVFVEADEVGWDGAGQLSCVSTRRPLYSYRPITSDTGQLYHSPSPLPDGTILVSRRPADGSGTHGIYQLDPRSGQSKLVYDDPAFHDMDARLLAPRPQPDGRSSVVDEDYRWGKLYCLNVYLADPDVTPHVRPGAIRRLRVIEGVPLPADDRSSYLPPDERSGIGGPGSTVNGLAPVVQRRLLGEIGVEADGSFQIEVPPDVPVQLQTLDEDGMALQSCGWIWAKPREPRGCVGCHEDPELTPENHLVEAMKKPAIKLTLPPEKRRTVDFRRDVMPIMAGKCSGADCHGGGSTPLNLSAERAGPFNRAYVSLLAERAAAASDDVPVVGKYVEPCRARTSPLIWRLFGRNTSRPWDRGGKPGQTFPSMPPPGANPLTDEEKRAFVEWIDLGAHWDGIPGADAVAASRGTAAQRGASQ